MRQLRCPQEADEAALAAYSSARQRGETVDRALSTAILSWLARCDYADGREARARVVEVLLRTHTMGPRDYEDWVIIALGDNIWDAGAPAAIHRLSIDCRALERDATADREKEFERIGLDELRDYLRLELPRKVRNLRRLARELLPADATHEDA